MKYSVEELTRLPLSRLQNIDIASVEEERVVQAEINRRVNSGGLPTGRVNRVDIPDIKTPEEEARWQQVVNDRAKALLVPSIITPNKPAEEEEEESAPEEEEIPVGTPDVPPVAMVARKGGRPKKITS